jgi:trafficking protein particle complex subunit 9
LTFNLANPQILTMNVMMSPSDHVLYQGVQSNIPVGRLTSGEEREVEIGLCFVSEGRFDLHAEALLVGCDADDDAKAGEGALRVFVRDDQ